MASSVCTDEMVTFDSIFGRIIGRIKGGMRRDDWAKAGAAGKVNAVAKVTNGLEDTMARLCPNIDQGPLIPARMRDWPSAESAKPRNAFTAGSMGLR